MKIFNLSLILSFICFTVNAQNYTDKINLKKGQVTEIVSDVNQVMSMGMDMTTITKLTTELRVMDVTDSDIKVKTVITKMKSTGDVAGTKVEFDSEKPDSENNPEMTQALKEKINSETEFLINRNTLAITNLSKKDAAEENPVESFMQAAGSDESAIVTEMLFLIPKGKKTGDTWNTKTDVKGIKTENTYTLKSVADGMASVDFKTESKIDQTLPMEGAEVTMDIKITNNGNFIVSTETGLLKKKSTNSTSEGTMDVMGQSMPVSIVSKIESVYSSK